MPRLLTPIPSEVVDSCEKTLSSLSILIGNTPLLEVRYELRGHTRVVYAKCEQFNLTGSIKDRMALHILRQAYATGKLGAGDTIAEATSGNTGIAFAALGRALGHPVTIFMPDWMSQERKDLIRAYGATIVPVSQEEGGFLGSIRMAEEFAKSRDDVFLPCQFSNQANAEAHEETTGPEILQQLQSLRLKPDAFVAGVGTGGTVMGVGAALRSQHAGVKVHPVEPAESPTLSRGHKVGKHRIQGISDEFIPALVDLKGLDEVIAISDGDAIVMAQKLAASGLAVGISSGCNFLAAVEAQERLGGDAVVVTVFADDNKKYLSTDLMRREPESKDFVATQLTVSGFTPVGRVCSLCSQTPAR